LSPARGKTGETRSNFVSIDLAPYPNPWAYMARVAARPKVREALVAEGLVAAPEGATA
jgi:glutathione S-transferase